ncbi:SPOR domain-containing protein [uncultured Piscinibacter sp.]|uniref:SPOR domain-containing protein n=1 Tax=uncultured Piscinibacter sp. TaxID=1131835 RepID=UPI0026297217|nr:SPOR domain-containing protein [uncultured Piscinibacter sp.]
MKRQRGGFAMGLIVGLLVGLALALAVALYVTKVPVPFVNKVPQRTAEQDAAEMEKNKNWDPNAGLSKPVGPKSPVAGASAPVTAAPATAPGAPPVAAAPRASAPASARDPAAILSARETSTVRPTPAADPFNYFVQAGAFARPEDAEQQRARLAMMGFEAKVSEREQSGRTVYRVRIGPFPRKDDADGAKEKLASAGVETALVRVQK